jgi:hypothetical protein
VIDGPDPPKGILFNRTITANCPPSITYLFFTPTPYKHSGVHLGMAKTNARRGLLRSWASSTSNFCESFQKLGEIPNCYGNYCETMAGLMDEKEP